MQRGTNSDDNAARRCDRWLTNVCLGSGRARSPEKERRFLAALALFVFLIATVRTVREI